MDAAGPEACLGEREALTLAAQAQQKFGGDSVLEMKRNFDGYIEQLRSF